MRVGAFGFVASALLVAAIPGAQAQVPGGALVMEWVAPDSAKDNSSLELEGNDRGLAWFRVGVVLVRHYACGIDAGIRVPVTVERFEKWSGASPNPALIKFSMPPGPSSPGLRWSENVTWDIRWDSQRKPHDANWTYRIGLGTPRVANCYGQPLTIENGLTLNVTGPTSTPGRASARSGNTDGVLPPSGLPALLVLGAALAYVRRTKP